MGRKPDKPEDQEAKGFPGKRKSKTEKLIAEARKRAELLAAAPAESGELLSPPAFIDDPMLADALWIWNRYAPELSKRNLFDDLDRLTFAMYCIYQAEFFVADHDIRTRGYYFMVNATAGDRRPWDNPSVARRDTAQKIVLELSKRFGLTPLDRGELERRHSLMDDGPLFRRRGDQDEAGPSAADAVAPTADESAIGILDRLDSVPPGQRPN